MDVAVSDNGVMMVTFQYVDGSKTTSYVAFYNYGDVGQNEDDRIVSGYTYENVVIPQVECISDSKYMLCEMMDFYLPGKPDSQRKQNSQCKTGDRKYIFQ